jgi:hypothetical protein
LHRERSIARGELGSRAAEGPVGVGALLEDPLDDVERDGARG